MAEAGHQVELEAEKKEEDKEDKEDKEEKKVASSEPNG